MTTFCCDICEEDSTTTCECPMCGVALCDSCRETDTHSEVDDYTRASLEAREKAAAAMAALLAREVQSCD